MPSEKDVLENVNLEDVLNTLKHSTLFYKLLSIINKLL